jgi:uncharacterized membrane-anchored protein
MSILRTFTLAGLSVGLVTLPLPAQDKTATTGSVPATAPGAPASTEADEEAEEKAFLAKIESLGWTREGKAKLGTISEVSIPQGWRFTDGNGTRTLLQMYGNLPGTGQLGMLTTEGHGPWVIFQFDNSGYVKDDEKNDLDADAMLKSLKEGQMHSNKRRLEMGLEELQLLGWAVAPRFNDQTKNLEWALRIGSPSGESINYSTRLLGRHGVMEVDLVCGPEEMDTLLPKYQEIIAGHQYVTGNTYAEYRAGDKVAEYGLTALVAGGATVVAGKMGLFAKLGGVFAKLGKGIIGVIVVIGLGLKALFGKLFGKGDQA